jgi:NADH:ubiquinone oxidoreductase subunit 3 (subunit A)
MVYFLIILTIGFVYEWKKGALGLGIAYIMNNIWLLEKSFSKIYNKHLS